MLLLISIVTKSGFKNSQEATLIALHNMDLPQNSDLNAKNLWVNKLHLQRGCDAERKGTHHLRTPHKTSHTGHVDRETSENRDKHGKNGSRKT